MEALLSWAKCQAYLAVGVDTGSENCGSSIIVCSLFSWYTLQNSICYEESFEKKHILYNRLLYKDVARFWNSSVHELNKVDSPRHKISMRLDCEQSLSFPSVFLAFLSAIKQQAASGRSVGAEEKEKERDCGGILIFSICRLWHLFDWWFRLVYNLRLSRGKVIVVQSINSKQPECSLVGKIVRLLWTVYHKPY